MSKKIDKVLHVKTHSKHHIVKIDKLYPSLMSDSKGYFFVIYQLNTVNENKNDLILIKMTKDFKVIWKNILDGDNPNNFYPSIIIDQTDQIIISYNTPIGDIILSKYDTDGQKIWTYRVDNDKRSFSNMYPSITCDQQHIYLTYQRKQIKTQSSYLIISELNHDGKILWTKDQLQNQSNINIYPSVSVDGSGYIYISCHMKRKDSSEQYDINIVKFNNEGEYQLVYQPDNCQDKNYKLFPMISHDQHNCLYLIYQINDLTTCSSSKPKNLTNGMTLHKLNAQGQTEW